MHIHNSFTWLFILFWLCASVPLTMAQPINAPETVNEPEPEPELELEPAEEPILEDTAVPDFESLAGIYAPEDSSQSWLFSVHLADDDIILIDISENLDFLTSVFYLRTEEAQQNIAVASEDRAFQGKLEFYPTQGYYLGQLNPILPDAQRVSDYSADALSKYGEGFNFFEVFFSVSQSPASGETIYSMELHRDTGSLSFMFGRFVKIF